MLENSDPSALALVGKSERRVDAVGKVTGDAIYTSDMSMPGMLYAQVKKSPHARARILGVDTSRAEALPGVRAVLVGSELDYRLGLYVVDKDILAKKEVRHYGEAVAAVAADSLETAREAVDLIAVEYELLPPVLNHMDALKPGAPLVHPDLGSYDYVPVFSPQAGTNIPNLSKLRKGDVEKGFAESEWIVEREYTNPSVQHVPMETHVAIVEWKNGDEVTIWTSAQSPFTVRALFCYTFKLPLNKVRVVVPHVGGGFGGKAGIHLEPLAACLSRKAGGRPVKLQASREEEFSLLPCRSALTYRIKTGVRADGRILAQELTLYWDAGAYADYAVNVTRASGYSAAGPYDIPNVKLDAYTIYTNKPYGTAYRGFGHVEFFWGLERHLELVAGAYREAGRRTINMWYFDVELLGGISSTSPTAHRRDQPARARPAATLPMQSQRPGRQGSPTWPRSTTTSPAATPSCTGPIDRRYDRGRGRNADVPGTAPQGLQCDVTYGTAKEFGFDFLRDLLRRLSPRATRAISWPANWVASQGVELEKPSKSLAPRPGSTRPTASSTDEARTPLIITRCPPR